MNLSLTKLGMKKLFVVVVVVALAQGHKLSAIYVPDALAWIRKHLGE